MSYVFVSKNEAKYSGVTTTTPTFSGFTVAAGESVFVYVTTQTGGVSNVTDGTNTYTQIGSTFTDGIGFQHAIFYNANVSAVSSGTLTYTVGNTATNFIALWVRYTGLLGAVTAVITKILNSTTGSNAMQSGTVSTNSPPAMMFSLAIEYAGFTVNAGNLDATGPAFNDRGQSSGVWTGSAFGWQYRMQDISIGDSAAHFAAATDTQANDIFVISAVLVSLSSGAGEPLGISTSPGIIGPC